MRTKTKLRIKKLTPVLALTILFVMSIALAGCGLFTVNGASSGSSVSKSQLNDMPLGSSENDVLTKFGDPSKQVKIKNGKGFERVWYYCWSRGTGGTFLYGTFSNEGTNTKCATFIFKNEKLVSRGIGNGNSGVGAVGVPAVIPMY